MNLQETAKELNRLVKSDKEIQLEDKINELEEVIKNLLERVDYLESRCA